MNPNTTETKSLSIRKVYLNKRAAIIRDTLAGAQNDIGGFIRQIQSREFNATKDEILFSRCLQWMRDNLHTEANIGDAARDLGVSVRKVQRLFSFFIDKSYTSILLDLRIDAAKNYLREMKNSVGEVAYLVGIPDHAYFTFLFRKTTGITPTDFRATLMRDQIG